MIKMYDYDEADQSWPGPTYSNCFRCGECTKTYDQRYCEKCEKEMKDETGRLR